MAKKVLFEVRERSADPAFQVVEDDNGVIQTHYGATYASEANVLVGAKYSVDASGKVTGLVGPTGESLYVSKGGICLIAPDNFTVPGTPDGATLTVPSATINSSAVGTAITWSETLYDTTSGGVWSLTNPDRIYVPDGVSYMNINASFAFTPNATGARMLRLLQSGTGHRSNNMSPTAHAVMAQSVPLNTGWFPVTPGEYYTLNAVQDSGTDRTNTASNVSNLGGSTYARVEFR